MRHTSGPWSTGGEQPGQVWVEHNGLTIAIATVAANDQNSITPAEMKANARLIAAAPDMLAALEKLARLGNGTQYGNSDGNIIAQDAIAKIKGPGKLSI